MDREVLIQRRLDSGKSFPEIGKELGISKQRVYQLAARYGIKTPELQRKNYIKSLPDKQKWLMRILYSKHNGSNRKALFDELKDKLPDNCPALNIVLDYSNSSGHFRDNSPSIDRIDSSKGYEVGNVHIISWKANRLKSNASPQELMALANYMNSLTE